MSIYGSPEKYDLKTIGEVDDAGASYSFDMVVVWSDKDNNLYFANDSGCSCPSPFEDFNSISDLTPLTRDNYNNFIDTMRNCGASLNDRDYLRKKVDEILRNKMGL